MGEGLDCCDILTFVTEVGEGLDCDSLFPTSSSERRFSISEVKNLGSGLNMRTT